MMIPVGVDLQYWADSLFVDYPDEEIPYLTDPADWQRWAETLLVSPVFASAGCPSPSQFSDWRDWAFALFRSLNV